MRPCLLLIALPPLALPLSSTAAGQGPRPVAASFAPPVRLYAGEKLLGSGRRIPSPVFHDVNGDGLADIVVGDLVGKVTVALRQRGAFAFGPEEPLLDVEGKEIDFHNW